MEKGIWIQIIIVAVIFLTVLPDIIQWVINYINKKCDGLKTDKDKGFRG